MVSSEFRNGFSDFDCLFWWGDLIWEVVEELWAEGEGEINDEEQAGNGGGGDWDREIFGASDAQQCARSDRYQRRAVQEEQPSVERWINGGVGVFEVPQVI